MLSAEFQAAIPRPPGWRMASGRRRRCAVVDALVVARLTDSPREAPDERKVKDETSRLGLAYLPFLRAFYVLDNSIVLPDFQRECSHNSCSEIVLQQSHCTGLGSDSVSFRHQSCSRRVP